MFFNKLAEEVISNEYFIELFEKINKKTTYQIFNETAEEEVTKKEFNHLLRFADILSNSSISTNRNFAYKIISLLEWSYGEHPAFKTVSTAVLSKLGNFPAIQFLNYTVELPFDRQIEKEIKQTKQKVEGNEGLFFTDSQFELFMRMKDSKYYSFSGPTSMGKSFMIKTLINNLISKENTGNIAIIVPTRALIHQFALDIKNDLKSVLDLKYYRVLTTGILDEIEEDKGYHHIFILTPERLLTYLSEESNPKIDYLFIDEAHKLAVEKDARSITLYTAVERTLKHNPQVSMYFASPNVSNPGIFLDLFNKNGENSFGTKEAPVAQNLYFVDLVEKLAIHFTEFGKKSFTPSSLFSNKSTVTSLDTIHVLAQGQSNLIYCNSVSDTVFKARDFSQLYGVRQFTKKEEKLLQQTINIIKEMIHEDYYLIDCLRKGVGYHFGNLPQVVRSNIENLFKQGIIKYLFCTSTLLEGVNLPAKNVFILKNKRGKSQFNKIDFWNLAGRAGRLNHELSGNIFCVREEEKDWKQLSVLEKGEITLTPTLTTQVEQKLKKIEEAIVNNKIKKGTEKEKEILQYIANIICIDTLELPNGYHSPVIQQLIDNHRFELIDLAKNAMKDIEVPTHILRGNQSIPALQQQEVYSYILNNKIFQDRILFPSKVNYKSCLAVLKLFHHLYDWDKKEKEKRLNKVENLSYFAQLMNNWMNGFSLQYLIRNSLSHKQENGSDTYYYENGRRMIEKFNQNNHKLVNYEINYLIRDIEGVLRFTLQKYFSHYYNLLVEVIGKEKAGENWATFLEYGTKNPSVITLQNMGLSRHVAMSIIKNYKNYLVFEKGKLLHVNREELINNLSDDSIEMEEIKLFL